MLGPVRGRNLRPGDSLPIGPLAEGLQPIDLPNGWREKYAGKPSKALAQPVHSMHSPHLYTVCMHATGVCILGRRLLVGIARTAVWIAHQEPRRIAVTPQQATLTQGGLAKILHQPPAVSAAFCFLQVKAENYSRALVKIFAE